MKEMLRYVGILCLASSILFSTPGYAQQKPIGKTEQALTGPRKQLATIIFAGLAGSILGLSTLSFYGRPQDHLENIAVGFAIGVISGTAYVTYKAAMQPEDFYGTDFSSPVSLNRGAFESYRLAEANKTFGPIYFSWNF